MIGHFIKNKKKLWRRLSLKLPLKIRFSDSYNVDDEKWGQPVADDVQNAVMLAFNQTISEDHLKKLLE